MRRADDQSDIGHEQHDEELQKALHGIRADAVPNDQAEQVSANDAENAADSSADEALQAHQPKPNLEQDNGATEQNANNRIEYPAEAKWLKKETCNSYGQDEYCSNKD